MRLTSKRYDGEHTPYMANTKWVDGSVRSDFPQERMSRLYNLNYTIASQVNPHVVPFMQDDAHRFRKDLLSWPERILRRQGKVLSMGVMDFTRQRLGAISPVRRLLDHGYGVIGQRYYGDVNIIAKYGLKHLPIHCKTLVRICLSVYNEKVSGRLGQKFPLLKLMHVLVKLFSIV